MIVLHYFLSLLIHFTTGQFPDHIDLQKVKEVSYKNGKYNVLKPTVHKITDYFEQFMLRTESRNDEKIFIDNDGFRHSWSDVAIKPKSPKKTDITIYNKQAISKSTEEDDTISTSEEGINIPILRIGTSHKPKPTSAKPKHATTKAKHNTQKLKSTPAKPKHPTTKPKPTPAKPKHATTKPKPTPTKPKQATTKPKFTPAKPKHATTKPKPTPVRPAAIVKLKGAAPTAPAAPAALAAQPASRKVAITSFFCPFLGVIKMMSIID